MENKVVILLSTYNGEKYLNEQLESLRLQSYENIHVLVRDDGSTDNTTDILKAWHNRYPNWISWYSGENVGYVKSFMELLYNAPSADYYAFCDQDDWWETDKVEVALNKLNDIGEISIYTSNVTYSDAKLVVRGNSHFFNNNTMWKALLYNQAVGCTIVISKKLREMIMKVDINEIDFREVYSHDCWMFRLCLAFGGQSCFDSEPHILYRQHGRNQVGGSASKIKTWIVRFQKLRGKNKNIKLKMSRELERCYGKYIEQHAYKNISEFNKYNKDILSRFKLASRREIYTDSVIANVSLWIAIIMGSI